MLDLNNRPGGPNLIVTAKTAHKVHFLDAATLTMDTTIDMPGSTHELAISADGQTAYGTVYGDGIFAKRVNPDRRIVVIDLPSKSLTRVIDLGARLCAARHHDGRVRHALVVGRTRQRGAGDRSGDRQGREGRGRLDRALGRGEPCHRQGVRVGEAGLARGDRSRDPQDDRPDRAAAVVEGLAVSPDGATVYSCAQDAAEFYVDRRQDVTR